MAYGITNESQLIDVATIKRGCESFLEALSFFVDGGNQVISAGYTCSKKAISVDNSSFENDLMEMGQQIVAIRDKYVAVAENIYQQAVTVYNNQVAELNEYNRYKAQQQAAQNRR
ncbi:MAG: hypothetical protein IJG68_02780 [Bacilli bacterium]|nr:hypothetical protein [Bacilli bacterium]